MKQEHWINNKSMNKYKEKNVIHVDVRVRSAIGRSTGSLVHHVSGMRTGM